MGQSKDKWLETMQEEMESLEKNTTYELMELPQGCRALKKKWVFKVKTDGPSRKPRYKAKLVGKGISQRKRIYYEEIFSSIVKMTSIRAVLAMATQQDLEIEQMDVKMAFLHGSLKEEIYMEQPEGFSQIGRNDLVHL